MNKEQISIVAEMVYPELDKDKQLVDFMNLKFIDREGKFFDEIAEQVFVKLTEYFKANKKFSGKYVYPYLETKEEVHNFVLIAAEITDILMILTDQYVDDRLRDHLMFNLYVN